MKRDTLQKEREEKAKDSNSSILSTPNEFSTELSDSSKSSSSYSYPASSNSKAIANNESCNTNNKIMEEELQIATNLVEDGQNTSFNPSNRNDEKESSQNSRNQGEKVSGRERHYVRKSISNVSDTVSSGRSYVVEHYEYPT